MGKGGHPPKKREIGEGKKKHTKTKNPTNHSAASSLEALGLAVCAGTVSAEGSLRIAARSSWTHGHTAVGGLRRCAAILRGPCRTSALQEGAGSPPRPAALQAVPAPS